jgi:hypothetical protein
MKHSQDNVLYLMKVFGMSAAQAADYAAVQIEGYTQSNWARKTTRKQQSVSFNVEMATEKRFEKPDTPTTIGG